MFKICDPAVGIWTVFLQRNQPAQINKKVVPVNKKQFSTGKSWIIIKNLVKLIRIEISSALMRLDVIIILQLAAMNTWIRLSHNYELFHPEGTVTEIECIIS